MYLKRARSARCLPGPALAHQVLDGIDIWSDPDLLARSGVLVAFTGRRGGVSAPPYHSLNLAAHVGDDPRAVDENRTRLLEALGMGQMRAPLTCAEQVHGVGLAVVDTANAGSGAHASGGPPPLASTDAMITSRPGVPLLMLYADCVPVTIVGEGPAPAVAVVHAGWRGALERLPESAARALAELFATDIDRMSAYIGPHIGKCCYAVDETRISHFRNRFDTITAVDGRLDLGAAVTEALVSAGLTEQRIVDLGTCTNDETDVYFSYRAHGVTGRHGALAVITKA